MQSLPMGAPFVPLANLPHEGEMPGRAEGVPAAAIHPACAADTSIHMNSQTWPSRSWKLMPYMKP